MSHPGWDGDRLLEDLRDETDSLLDLVADLDDEGLDTPTPADPWTIRDQLSHLAGFDERAAAAATDPDRFLAGLADDIASDLGSRHLAHGRSLSAAEARVWFGDERAALMAVVRPLDPRDRRPWYGPPMTIRSSITARLMETWAHGVDVADALGVARDPSMRLFEVAELGVKTFRWSFANRGLDVPEARVRVTLTGPDGGERTWNPASDDSVTGLVEEFCLVVAQRRHVLDTSLLVTGPTASSWMQHAQIFAGPPTPGRPAPPRTQGS